MRGQVDTGKKIQGKGREQVASVDIRWPEEGTQSRGGSKVETVFPPVPAVRMAETEGVVGPGLVFRAPSSPLAHLPACLTSPFPTAAL